MTIDEVLHLNKFIETEDLTFSYEEENEHEIPALDGVSVSIDEGEYVAILGHNGSGKSTLAKLLNMILVPERGVIRIGGEDITAPDFSEDDMFRIRRDVGMVFQNPDNQLVATIVEDDVAFGPENLGVPPAEIRRRVDAALETVGMTRYARHEPHRLSGGQKQRVAIAGLIAMLPSCMIFDEATAMLDPSGRREVIETMEKLNREQGITVLTITHYMNEAARADRVIVIDDGRVLADGTPHEIFADPGRLIAAGLDVPQCTSLIHALRGEGIALAGEPISPEECAELICAALEEKKHGNTLS